MVAGTLPLHCMSMSHFSFREVWLFLHLNEYIIECVTPKRNLDSPKKLGKAEADLALAHLCCMREYCLQAFLKSPRFSKSPIWITNTTY